MYSNIKHVRPNKRYKAGCINPNSCKKLFESQKGKPIIYRSSYERQFIQWLETSHRVVHWGSECVGIRYTNKADGTSHIYYPDYIVEVYKDLTDPSQGTDVFIVEIKPWSQTQPPSQSLPRDSYAWKEYIRNVSKWDAAVAYAARNNVKFKIFTERTISRLI